MPERRPNRISPLVGAEELSKKISAAAAGGEDDLPFIDLHGHRFLLPLPPSPVPTQSAEETAWTDFTETAYRKLLDITKARYRFAKYGDRNRDRHVLWRHDLDTSVHRALSLAEIEHKKGVTATYFFCLRLPYYNLLEPAVQDVARRIVSLGHGAGLHFDPSAYPEESWTLTRLEQCLTEERELLARILDTDVEAVSFHDPTHGDFLRFDDWELAGMVNAYGRELRENYGYCSDSNGYWRFDPIGEVIAAGRHERLQVLTHPEWWTPEPMAPRRRIERAILGRARAAMHGYDQHLARSGRINIDC